MNELQHLGRVNFGLAVGTLLYLATNVVLFTFNAMDGNDDACGDPEGIKYARCGSPVSPLQFHIYEFWAGFLFACIEATSLIWGRCTPRADLYTVSKRPGIALADGVNVRYYVDVHRRCFSNVQFGRLRSAGS